MNLTYLSYLVLVPIILWIPGTAVLMGWKATRPWAVFLGPMATSLLACAVVSIAQLVDISVGFATRLAFGGWLLLAVWAFRRSRRVERSLSDTTPLRRARMWLSKPVGIAVLAATGLYLVSGAHMAIPTSFKDFTFWGVGTVGPLRVESPKWPAAPIDNQLSFRTGQIMVHKQSGAVFRDDFTPGWWISDRTPLPGMVFAAVASGLSVEVTPRDLIKIPEDESWDARGSVDPFGYWFYNQVMCFLGALPVLGIAAIASTTGFRSAWRSVVLFAVSPTVLAHLLYPMPKLASTYGVLLAVALILSIYRSDAPKRWNHSWKLLVISGIAAASAYLTHPSTVLWIPALAVAILGVEGNAAARLKSFARDFGTFLVGLIGPLIPWFVFLARLGGGNAQLIAPLGADPSRASPISVSTAFHDFVQRGFADAASRRLWSLLRTVLPMSVKDSYIDVPTLERLTSWNRLFAPFHTFVRDNLVAAVGIPLLIAAIIASARYRRQPPTVKKLIMFYAIGVLMLTAYAGRRESYFFSSAFPLVATFFVLGSIQLERCWRTPLKGWLVFCSVAIFQVGEWIALLRPDHIGATGIASWFFIAVIGWMLICGAWKLCGSIETTDSIEGPTLEPGGTPLSAVLNR